MTPLTRKWRQFKNFLNVCVTSIYETKLINCRPATSRQIPKVKVPQTVFLPSTPPCTQTKRCYPCKQGMPVTRFRPLLVCYSFSSRKLKRTGRRVSIPGSGEDVWFVTAFRLLWGSPSCQQEGCMGWFP